MGLPVADGSSKRPSPELAGQADTGQGSSVPPRPGRQPAGPTSPDGLAAPGPGLRSSNRLEVGLGPGPGDSRSPAGGRSSEPPLTRKFIGRSGEGRSAVAVGIPQAVTVPVRVCLLKVVMPEAVEPARPVGPGEARKLPAVALGPTDAPSLPGPETVRPDEVSGKRDAPKPARVADGPGNDRQPPGRGLARPPVRSAIAAPGKPGSG